MIDNRNGNNGDGDNDGGDGCAGSGRSPLRVAGDSHGVGGAQRPAAVGSIVVALIGPTYRVAVFQVPAMLVNDATTGHLAKDLFMPGILLP